jgi:hypothetical protein
MIGQTVVSDGFARKVKNCIFTLSPHTFHYKDKKLIKLRQKNCSDLGGKVWSFGRYFGVVVN